MKKERSAVAAEMIKKWENWRETKPREYAEQQLAIWVARQQEVALCTAQRDRWWLNLYAQLRWLNAAPQLMVVLGNLERGMRRVK